MRYGAEHKQSTHERLLKNAAAAIRKYGPNKVSVAGVMAESGLTHGGFYAHFKSKDHLVIEAIGQMFDERADRLASLREQYGAAAGLAKYIDTYLDIGHRDNREQGCPLPTLSGDLPRMSAQTREQFEIGAQRLVDSIAQTLRSLGVSNPESSAASILAELVGAIALSRAVTSADVSQQILMAVRENIHARISSMIN